MTVQMTITGCDVCPHMKSERFYTADSFESAQEWKCARADGKRITLHEWNDKNPDIPSWCPLAKNWPDNKEKAPLECRVMPLPCPFCGCDTITVTDGSTFRWAIGECDNCGASCGEVRINTMQQRNEDEILADVIEEWNKRHI